MPIERKRTMRIWRMAIALAQPMWLFGLLLVAVSIR